MDDIRKNELDNLIINRLKMGIIAIEREHANKKQEREYEINNKIKKMIEREVSKEK